MIRRGEIYHIVFDPTVGSEANKTRPALVLSNDQNNEHGGTVTVLPISTKIQRVYPFEVELPRGQAGIAQDSKIMAHHIRSIDKRRLRGLPLGPTLDVPIMDQVEKAIKLHLGIA